VENLKEIVWCDHLVVYPRPIVMSGVPHVFVSGPQGLYLAVEEGKVKLICNECWIRSQQLSIKLDVPDHVDG